MITIRAKLRLNETRRKGFYSGYRPLFNLHQKSKFSGRIDLLDREILEPGDETEVEVTFVSEDLRANMIHSGQTFTFDEGFEPLGEGKVQAILE